MADNITFSAQGQINLSGDDRALYLKRFAGRILNRFDELHMADRIQKIISVGGGLKELQFPASWKATAQYYTQGTELLAGNQIAQGERTIKIDDFLLSYIWVTELDMMLTHMALREEYAHQIAEAVAQVRDEHTLQMIALAARASATITGAEGGSRITNAGFATSGQAISTGLFAAAQIFDEKRVPPNDRNVTLRPNAYYNMVQTPNLINRDFGNTGSLESGKLGTHHANIMINKSNNVPNTDKSGDSTTGHKNTYVGDFSKLIGVVNTKDATGALIRSGMTTESQYYTTYQATILVAKILMGQNILRPECAITLETP